MTIDKILKERSLKEILEEIDGHASNATDISKTLDVLHSDENKVVVAKASVETAEIERPRYVYLPVINKIVQEAFGKGAKGNYHSSHDYILKDGPYRGLDFFEKENERDIPLLVATRLGFFSGGRGEIIAQIGRNNLNTDGSVIIVFPKYEKKAKRYAEIYDREVGKVTGRQAKIIVADKLNLNNDFGFVNQNLNDKILVLKDDVEYAVVNANKLAKSNIYDFQIHPRFTKDNGSVILRPLTFKETIEAIVNDYNSNIGKDKMRLLNESFNTSTGIVSGNRKNGHNFKIIPLSNRLIKLYPLSNCSFLNMPYEEVEGLEITRGANTLYNMPLNPQQVMKHEGWLNAVENDNVLLKEYRDIVFSIFDKNGNKKERAMAFNPLSGNSCSINDLSIHNCNTDNETLCIDGNWSVIRIGNKK